MQPVLIENNGKGHTDGFAPVAVADASRGDARTARIVGRDRGMLTAVWA
jgi:threonylcarbamoyladenosine tRNA methylthiotransferase MtaB